MTVLPADKVKDVLVTKTAIKLLKPENVVEAIVNFQFKDAIAHIRETNEVEISGFGKFYISPAKAKRRLERLYTSLNKVNEELNNPTTPLERIKALSPKKESILQAINFLKQKNDSRLERTN